MARTCTVCTHGEAHAVNVALVQRDSYRKIAEQYGLSQAALVEKHEAAAAQLREESGGGG